MKKNGVLNKDLSEIIAGMGHTDTLVVADAGLPVPPGIRRVDLAVTEGLPGLLATVEVIAKELQVERVIVAQEMETNSPHILEGLMQILAGVEVVKVPHGDLKDLCKDTTAIVRTGEFTWYANVVLVSGVVF